MANQLKITLKRSTIGCLKKQIATVEALGLHKIGEVKIHPDSVTTRGMITVVNHLVSVEEIE
ncbi:MAG: 50S ribosomal protein L30 [Clostridia bacterium]